MLQFNLMSQAMVANQRIPESLQNDSPCRRWLHLFHKLIKDSKESILGITVLLINGVDSGFRQFQHASKFVGFRSHIKYFTHHVRNITLTQNSVFERVSLCKSKAKIPKRRQARPRSPNCIYTLSQGLHLVSNLSFRISVINTALGRRQTKQ